MKSRSFFSLGAVLTAASVAMFSVADMVGSRSAEAADKVKVGFVFTPSDHGWTYAHEVGRQQVEKHFGNKVETTMSRTCRKDQIGTSNPRIGQKGQ